MRQTIGALAALTLLGIILVGPLYAAVNAATDRGDSVYRCGSDMGCDVGNPSGLTAVSG
ncbi:MAG: hypothetical protein AAGB11_14655 [Pseudomonadota bacterium]